MALAHSTIKTRSRRGALAVPTNLKTAAKPAKI